MGQVQLSDRQSSFIFYLVHQGKGRTEAARLAGFAAPRQSALVWNSGVVEVAYTTCADIVEEFIVSVIFTTKFTTK